MSVRYVQKQMTSNSRLSEDVQNVDSFGEGTDLRIVAKLRRPVDRWIIEGTLCDEEPPAQTHALRGLVERARSLTGLDDDRRPADRGHEFVAFWEVAREHTLAGSELRDEEMLRVDLLLQPLVLRRVCLIERC